MVKKKIKIKANTTIYRNNTTVVIILKNKVYDLFAEFLTEKMFCGKCYIILTEQNIYKGLDADYFDIVD